jgi:hypothetical protein
MEILHSEEREFCGKMPIMWSLSETVSLVGVDTNVVG